MGFVGHTFTPVSPRNVSSVRCSFSASFLALWRTARCRSAGELGAADQKYGAIIGPRLVMTSLDGEGDQPRA